MAEIMSTLKEAILEEQKIDSPLIVRAFLDKLIKASTSANLIFDTQNVDISAFTENDTDNYDADGSESETEEDNNTKLENSECKGKIIYPGLLTYLVKIMEGLVTMNLHKFEEAIESVLSKLTALCNNEVFLNTNLILIFLSMLNLISRPILRYYWTSIFLCPCCSKCLQFISLWMTHCACLLCLQLICNLSQNFALTK